MVVKVGNIFFDVETPIFSLLLYLNLPTFLNVESNPLAKTKPIACL